MTDDTDDTDSTDDTTTTWLVKSDWSLEISLSSASPKVQYFQNQ
jgi:hypothetical protein